MAPFYNEEYRKLSRQGQEFLRSGKLQFYSDTLKQMARILLAEGNRIDQMKVLMLAFYIDLSGVGIWPYVDEILAEELRKAIVETQIGIYQFRELYLETARDDVTPRHIMSVSDTLYLLENVLERKNDVVEEIISKTACRLEVE